MSPMKLGALLLAATALTPITAAQAAPNDEMCQQLFQLAEEAKDQELKAEYRDVNKIANADVRTDCEAWLTRISEDGGTIVMAAKIDTEEKEGAADTAKATSVDTETETFTEKKQLSETIEIERAAIVEGRVVVRVPNPQIDVKQAAPTISVTETPVSVDVEERAAEIIVKQKPAKIRIAMPKPTITIEQPAPEIIVQLPPPGVSIEDEAPRISIRMPEPTVTVSQADPSVNVDVNARLVEPDEAAAINTEEGSVKTRTERVSASGENRETGADSDVTITSADAKLQMRGQDREPTVNLTRAQPKVRYEAADPDIEVSFNEEPTVKIEQVGEPKVRFIRREADGTNQAPTEDRAENSGDEKMADKDAEPKQAMADKDAEPKQAMADTETEPKQENAAKDEEVEPVKATREPLDENATRSLLTNKDGVEVDKATADILVGDLLNREVLGANGEDVGDVDRIIRQGEQTFVIIEHGGFLGIGDSEVAIPMNRLAMRGGELVLIGMTEEEVEALPEFDYGNETIVDSGQAVTIGTVKQ